MTDDRIEVVDAQVHAWAPDSTRYPWDRSYGRPPHTDDPVQTEMLVSAMDASGVDAAVIVTSFVYGHDDRYALDAAAAFPTRFGVVGRLDPLATDVRSRLRHWREQPGMLGVRIAITSDEHRRSWYRGDHRSMIGAAEEYGIPLYFYPPHLLSEVEPVVREHAALQFVIDHLALPAVPVMPAGSDPFQELPDLLALARFPNVAVKLSAVPAFSRQGFPFRDIWPIVRRVVGAFGPDRVMWGSDFTRVRPLHSYRDAAAYLRQMDFTSKENELLLGATLRRVLRWPRDARS